MRSFLTTGAGSLHTGGICRADADGYFYVVDRLKEHQVRWRPRRTGATGGGPAPTPERRRRRGHRDPDEELSEVPKAFVVSPESFSDGSAVATVEGSVARGWPSSVTERICSMSAASRG